ncbi:hypothetical protein AMTR_s00114p00113990 [Amborella trichopoda]|uniref:Vps72/YL1 C-terminal domain-containing protein n=2 Tax=Amborella trichopoda TaxID=13333 RepID=W1NUC7_AMBTC|nr:hypothetical protein AMTR_s00114p00113990 [Amborella trichopoda]
MDPMASSAEQEVMLLPRSARKTRGRRMSKLLDEEIEEDELFWNQDALKEEELDAEYEEEAEVADEFDSDFDEDEPEPDDEEAKNDGDERERVKKKLIFPGKKAVKKKSKKKVLAAIPKAENSSETPEPMQLEHQDIPDDLEGERAVRKSTRTSVIVRQAERDAIKAALQATMRPVKRKKEGEEKRMTQEEMLLEAAQTEIVNLRNLERVLAREEEVKKRAVVHKAVYNGPQIRFLSRNGKTFLEFNNGATFESAIATTPASYAEPAVCAITSMPAKYRDPKTGLLYATKEAFKIIRER